MNIGDILMQRIILKNIFPKSADEAICQGRATGLGSPPGIPGSGVEKQGFEAKLLYCVSSSSQNCLMLVFMPKETSRGF